LNGLLGGLLSEASDDDLILFYQEGTPLPECVARPRARVVTAPLTRPTRAATIWDQVAWPPTLARHRVDVFHSPFWTIPVLAASRVAIVQTIHDLTPIKLRGSVSMKNEMIFRTNFACARLARRIIVPSRATMADAVALAGIPSEKIAVVPEGVDIAPDLIARAESALPALRERLGLRGRYVIHTGGQDKVKNLGAAVKAAGLLVRGGADLRLVVTGEAGAASREIAREAEASRLGDRLVLSGFLEREDLVALYRGAAALLYPSRNEGFGLPVVEAMACGTPVVAARAGSLPEVGGGACLYVDPDEPERLAAAVASILNDDALARRLSEAGRARSAVFDWREAARRTLEVYRDAAGA